eukprot:scaffold9273_cov128-Isochrysis_galbana.AAC.2
MFLPPSLHAAAWAGRRSYGQPASATARSLCSRCTLFRAARTGPGRGRERRSPSAAACPSRASHSPCPCSEACVGRPRTTHGPKQSRSRWPTAAPRRRPRRGRPHTAAGRSRTGRDRFHGPRLGLRSAPPSARTRQVTERPPPTLLEFLRKKVSPSVHACLTYGDRSPVSRHLSRSTLRMAWAETAVEGAVQVDRSGQAYHESGECTFGQICRSAICECAPMK